MTVVKIMKKINKRIPGLLPSPPKTEIDGKLTDLSTKTISELLELQDRQVKLMNNKVFISKLADKGAKIKDFHNKIVRQLESKREEKQTCELLGDLKLGDKQSIQHVEWVGKLTNKTEVFLDSDDDSEPEDLLQILSHTSQEKKIIVLEPEQPLVTPEDLVSIGEVPHVKYIVDKTNVKPNPKVAGQFKPYKTTISNVHNPEKELQRKKHKHWEVTAATPPPIVHGPAVVLTLDESLKLQKEYNIHLKEVEVRHAAEKLFARTGIKMPELPADVSNFGKFREADSEDSEHSDPEGSDKEVYDEEPERGGVIFNVMK